MNNPPIESEESTDDEGFAFILESIRKEPEGLMIQRTKVLFGVAPLDFPRYQTAIKVTVGQDMRTQQPLVATGIIQIHATSLEDAFRKLPDVTKSAINELREAARKEMRKPRIATPGDVPGSSLNHDGPQMRFDPNA